MQEFITSSPTRVPGFGRVTQALQAAERFMAGFEGDQSQEGVTETLAEIRGILEAIEVAPPKAGDFFVYIDPGADEGEAFWSNTDGWGDLAGATIFSAEEAAVHRAPWSASGQPCHMAALSGAHAKWRREAGADRLKRLICEFVRAKDDVDTNKPNAESPSLTAYFLALDGLRSVAEHYEATLWPQEADSAAHAEGWSIFNFPAAPEIRRVESMDAFENDEAAIRFVRSMAKCKSPHALLALELHYQTHPEARPAS